MASIPDNLTPPKRSNTDDPGAKELESESDDHFSDAQSAPMSPTSSSPVPRLRVEKVSDEPRYGEVPGTEAYRLREGDAEPDEIAIIADSNKEAATTAEVPDGKSLPPGGQAIPITVVEESSGETGPHSEAFEQRHKADAPPDLVLKQDGSISGDAGTDADAEAAPISPAFMSPMSDRASRVPSRSLNSPLPLGDPQRSDGDDEEEEDEHDDDDDDDDGFGEDFDDFEEGEDADFDDFEEGFQQPEPQAVRTTPAPAQAAVPLSPLPFPVPDFDGLDSDEISSALEPYLAALYPPHELDVPELPPPSKDSSLFITPRSASLWSQLVAPPPLAPPDWIRSRIRRLFLVSLGVPVDLDEILPASKQKKLVLPSLNLGTSPRTSSDLRSVNRLKQGEGNASSTSVDSQGKQRSGSRKRKGPPMPPDMDLVSARQLCVTTDEALRGMTDAELKDHVEKLEALEFRSKEVLEYWKKQADAKIGDREAFEGVIENLVKHARKVRK